MWLIPTEQGFWSLAGGGGAAGWSPVSAQDNGPSCPSSGPSAGAPPAARSGGCLDYGLLSLLASVPCAPQAGAKAADKDVFAFLPGDSTLALCQPRPRPPAQRGRRPSKVPGCTGCAGLAGGPTGREPGLWSLLLRLWPWHQGAGDMEGFAGG